VKIRSFYVVPVMVVLSAYASTDFDQPIATFRNAVYRIGDTPAQMSPSTRPDEARPAVGVHALSKSTPQTDGPVF
jgi:hypothetical protein